MDIDIYSILSNFVEWFVLEEAKEQSSFELKDPKKRHLFTQKLNHNWDHVLDLRFVHHLDAGHDSAAHVKKEMHTKGRDLCYVISSDPEIDNKIMESDFVIDKVYGKGIGTILINLQVDKIYLETEAQNGTSSRFIGRKADLK